MLDDAPSRIFQQADARHQSEALVCGVLTSLILHGAVLASVVMASVPALPLHVPVAPVKIPITVNIITLASVTPHPTRPTESLLKFPAPPVSKPKQVSLAPRPVILASDKVVASNVLPIPPATALTVATRPAAIDIPVVKDTRQNHASTEPRFDATYLNNPKPAYPALSRRMREEGTVLLQVTVTAEGSVENIRISHGSGFSRLDDAAHEMVLRWRFIPARVGNDNIKSSVLVPLVFRLED